MSAYHDNLENVEAERWHRAGDLTALSAKMPVVKPYRRDGVLDTSPCVTCKVPMSSHGWIDPPSAAYPPETSTTPVDPVTGILVPAVSVEAPEFPVTYTKLDEADRIVANAAERQAALDAGYYPAVVEPPATPSPVPAPAATRELDPERKDLEGLVVHPGNYVIQKVRTGEVSIMPADQFSHRYPKVF